MTRIVLDPDEVNQDRKVTLTDGTVVVLGDAGATLLDRIARQLHVHRSSYQHALRSGDADLDDRVAAGEVPLEDVAPLHLRVSALQAAARGGRGRAVEELDVELLFQRRVWVSSGGVSRPLTELTPTHRRNLLGWLDRNSEALHARVRSADLSPAVTGGYVEAEPWIAGTPLHRRLTELVTSESGREQAIDRARQIARSVEFERSGRWPDR